MASGEEDSVNEEISANATDEGVEEDEFDVDANDEDAAPADFEALADDGDGEGDDDYDVEVDLSNKQQNARSLEIRRAIEARMEERHFHEDIDYLDYDFDD